MQAHYFQAYCPFEIGDRVAVKPFGNIETIRDIRTVQYLRSGTVEFEFQMENHQANWIKAQYLICRVDKDGKPIQEGAK